MPCVSLLIKPASGSCNMRCRYCFYEDETKNREIPSYGRMTLDTLEAIVRRSLESGTRGCSFMFQGGEPTLVGLSFYRALIGLVTRYNTKHVPVHYALQTNGYVIDEEWARFLAENHFLIGLSLDGVKDVHDYNRLDAQGKGTYQRTMHAAQLFKQYGAEFNILTVVTAQTARNIGKIYGFYKRSGLLYQQYIPCLDPLGEERGAHDYSLTPPLYLMFLRNLFDLWYLDRRRGEPVYNRYFENLAAILCGRPPESCGMLGHCTNQFVVEADGSVYPCDFYVLDQYRLGNLVTDSFSQLQESCEKTGFIAQSLSIPEECRACRWAFLCRAGCRRDREPIVEGAPVHNYFCTVYQEFFDYAVPRLRELI